MSDPLDIANRDGEKARGGNDSRDVLLSFSSEEPVLRGGCYEVLSHDPGAVDLTELWRGAPLLTDHVPWRKVGVVRDAWLEGKLGLARVRINRGLAGQTILQGVKKGIFWDSSMGYRFAPSAITEADEIDGKPVFRLEKWTPFEISLSSGNMLPRDPTVGVNRMEGETRAGRIHAEEKTMICRGGKIRVRPASDFELVERRGLALPLTEGEFDLLAGLKLADTKMFRAVYEALWWEKTVKKAGMKEFTAEEFGRLVKEIKAMQE